MEMNDAEQAVVVDNHLLPKFDANPAPVDR